MENTKLIKRAKIIDRILKILQGFAIAGVIVCAVFIPLTAVFGEQVIASSNDMTIGVLDLKLIGSPESYLNMPNISVSIIYDRDMLTGYKDSPIDLTKEIFLKLFKSRVRL